MFAAALLTAVLAPQDPIADRLSTLWDRHGVEREVAAVVGDLSRVKDGAIAGPGAPEFVNLLRKAGAGTLDAASAEVILPELASDPLTVFDLARELLDGREVSRSKRPKLKPGPRLLRDFENLLEDVDKDVRRGLGAGRGLDREAPKLVGLLERIARSPRLALESKDDREDVGERWERIAKVDREQLLEAASTIVVAAFELGGPDHLKRLHDMPLGPPRGLGGVEGQVLLDRDTPFGRLVVGGPGKNVYDGSQIEVIVDVGGDDEYRGTVAGATGLRRLAIVIDCAGDDRYESLNDALGSATYGVAALVDLAGKDVYRGGDRCAGFGAGGIGIFVDVAGDDDVQIGNHSGGVGLAGVGVFADIAGKDVQKGGVQALGCGLPAGIGLFVDGDGADTRELGGQAAELIGEEPIAVGFGCGVGLLPDLSGGLGVLVDVGTQTDEYTAQGLSLGVGVRGGAGVFRDGGGDDRYHTGVGGIGVGITRGVGVFLDEGGSDVYQGGSMSFASAAFGGAAWFLDRAGEDRYTSQRPSFGATTGGSLAVFVDQAGTDRYQQLGDDEVWPGPSWLPDKRVRTRSIGVLLDGGTGDDVYEFPGSAKPTPGGERVFEFERNPGKSVLILVDG